MSKLEDRVMEQALKDLIYSQIDPQRFDHSKTVEDLKRKVSIVEDHLSRLLKMDPEERRKGCQIYNDIQNNKFIENEDLERQIKVMEAWDPPTGNHNDVRNNVINILYGKKHTLYKEYEVNDWFIKELQSTDYN